MHAQPWTRTSVWGGRERGGQRGGKGDTCNSVNSEKSQDAAERPGRPRLLRGGRRRERDAEVGTWRATEGPPRVLRSIELIPEQNTQEGDSW